MKKVMICAMILLPLIILLVMSVSGVIVNSTTYLYVENISFVEDDVTLQKTSDEPVTMQLLVNILPKFANNKEVTYWSDDESIVSINESGVITGKEFGETYVYVKSKENETKIDTCKVTVTDNKIHQIKIDNAISSMYTYSTYRLETSIYPTTVDNPKLIYSSSNTNVLTVSEDGELKSTDVLGKSKITIYSEANIDAKVELDVEVKNRIEGITISDSSKESIGSLSYKFPEITFYPEGTSAAISYSSSNEDIATVDSEGNVTFKKSGTITITATAEGGASVSKTITSTNGYYNTFVFTNTSLTVDYKENGVLDLEYSATPYDADKAFLIFTSSNNNVIKVENGKFYICGGGTAVITASYKTSTRSTRTTKCTVNVVRQPEKIAAYDLYNNETNYIVTTKNSIELKAEVVPNDANYTSFTTTLDDTVSCRITNGVLYFLKDEYLSVNVKYSISEGIENTVKYVYIPSKYNPSLASKGETSLSLYMPSSDSIQKVITSPFIQAKDVKNVEYIVDDSSIIVNNETVEINDTKSFTLKIKVNGEDYSTILYDVKRNVERIDDIKFYGVDGASKELLTISNGKIYTGFKEIEISYSLYPSNTTLKEANLSVSGDVATIQNQTIVFSSNGTIGLNIIADNAKYYYSIESTCGLFDKYVSIKDSLTLNALDEIDAKDLFTTYSPSNASVEYISLITSDENLLKVNSDKSISALHGGNVSLEVSILTQNGTFTKDILVQINETASRIDLDNTFIYTQKDKINLLDYYSIFPTTSNIQTEITYTIVEGISYSSISNSTLNFSNYGLTKVNIKTANNIENTISFIYYGTLELVNGEDSVIDYEIDKPFVLKVQDPILSSANALDSFSASGAATISNGVVITLNSVTLDKKANAVVSFNEKDYSLRGIIKSTKVLLNINNAIDADVIGDNSYITGLKQIVLNPSILPSNATNDEIEYTISNSDIASMNLNTLVFKKEGEVDITAKNKDGNLATIKVYSTYGKIKSLTLNQNSLTYGFDNDNSLNNIKDISSIFNVYPSQIVLSKDNISFVISNEIASFNGTTITLLSGGSSTIRAYINNEKDVACTIAINIERCAYSIKLNDVEIGTISTIQENASSLKFLKLQALPLDATKNLDINTEIVSGSSYASLNNNILKFNEISKNVEVKFTLGSGEAEKSWTITYVATSLIQIVDIDEEIIVAPCNEEFAFYSPNSNTFSFVSSTVTLTINGENNYSYDTSNKGKIVLNINGSNVEKDFYITDRVYEITNVKINDTENSIAKAIDIKNNGLHETGSKVLSISFDDFDYALNKDGSKPIITYTSSNESIAEFINGNITFKTNGEVKFTISIIGEDYYGNYLTEYSFNVYSSFGIVDDFTLINPYESGVIIDNISEFNLNSSITPTLPKYGSLSPNYSYSSSDENIIKIDENGNVSFVGSGTATISVKTISGRGIDTIKSISIKVDKYIDVINVIDENGKIYQDATNNLTYQINTELLSKTKAIPTLVDISYEILLGDATVNSNGLITFTSDNTKCKVRIYANLGSSETTFTIYKLDNSTTIYDVNSSVYTIAFDMDKNVFLNTQFSDGLVSYNVSANSNFEVVNSSVNSFKGVIGSENTIELDGVEKELNIIVMQDVLDILFKVDAPDDSYLIAEDEVDLINIYGAYISPLTATDENGQILVSYSVNNITGSASIKDGILTFTKQGVVEIKFTAGNIVKTKRIESTMYYAKSVEFPSSLQVEFEYLDGEYQIPIDDCIVLPSNATKQNIFFTSSNEDVFKIENNKIIFTGGGVANLELNYYTKENVYSTISRQIFVNNRAKSITAKDGDDIVGYIVKNADFTLETMVNFDGTKLSSYSLSFTSLDTSIATVNNLGLVKFLVKDKPVTIKIEVINGEDNAIDASCNVVVLSSSYLIQKVYDGSSIVVNYDDSKNTILYPIINKSDSSFTYSVLSGADILTINTSNGIIAPLKGGNSSISITSSSSSFNIDVFVNRNVSSIEFTNTNIGDSTYITSKTSVELGTYLMPLDAALNKTISYEYDTSIASLDANGVVTFNDAGVLKITIKAMYGSNVECVKNITIQSSYNSVISFDVMKDSSLLASNYTLNNVGDSIKFNITNICPTDYVGTISATTTNQDVFEISINGNEVTVLGISKGSGIVEFSIEDVKYKTNINVLLKSTSVAAFYEGSQVSQLTTLADSLKISAIVYPLDASNTTYSYSIDGGAAIDANGNISLSGCSYGTYNVTIYSNDCASSTVLKIYYIEDISGIQVKYQGEEIEENDTIHLKYNEEEIVLSLDTIPSTIGTDYSLFTMESLNGSTGTMSGNKLIVKTLSIDTNPAFEDTITIKYKSIISYSIKLSRFGVKSVDFGDHTAQNDALCGLQQIRLTGNYSYYDGAKVAYYKMPLNVTPSSLYNKIVWDSTSSNVTVEACDGYAKVYLSTTAASTREQVAADDFSAGEFTLYAKDDEGNILAQYTYHVVSGTNVYDQAGFINGGSAIVLQKNFGHDYEETQGMEDCVRLDTYVARTIIYGNGYLVNYAARNSATTESTYTDYGYIRCSIQYAYNVVFRGGNISDGIENIYTAICNPYEISYCEVTYFCRGIEALKSGTEKKTIINKCLLRSIYYEAIYLNYYEQEVYLEDIIVFDTGATAIELEKPTLYIKGFMDVYNYQNKDKLATILQNIVDISGMTTLANSLIKSIAKNNENYAKEQADGVYYCNITVVGTQKASPSTLYFYDKSTDAYVESTDGTSSTMNGLKRLDISSLLDIVNKLLGYNIYVWAMPDIEGYPRWSDQYNDDGTVNYSCLANKELKLNRSWRVNNSL